MDHNSAELLAQLERLLDGEAPGFVSVNVPEYDLLEVFVSPRGLFEFAIYVAQAAIALYPPASKLPREVTVSGDLLQIDPFDLTFARHVDDSGRSCLSDEKVKRLGELVNNLGAPWEMSQQDLLLETPEYNACTFTGNQTGYVRLSVELLRLSSRLFDGQDREKGITVGEPVQEEGSLIVHPFESHALRIQPPAPRPRRENLVIAAVFLITMGGICLLCCGAFHAMVVAVNLLKSLK